MHEYCGQWRRMRADKSSARTPTHGLRRVPAADFAGGDRDVLAAFLRPGRPNRRARSSSPGRRAAEGRRLRVSVSSAEWRPAADDAFPPRTSWAGERDAPFRVSSADEGGSQSPRLRRPRFVRAGSHGAATHGGPRFSVAAFDSRSAALPLPFRWEIRTQMFLVYASEGLLLVDRCLIGFQIQRRTIPAFCQKRPKPRGYDSVARRRRQRQVEIPASDVAHTRR